MEANRKPLAENHCSDKEAQETVSSPTSHNLLQRSTCKGGLQILLHSTTIALWISLITMVCSRYIYSKYTMKMHSNLLWDEERMDREMTYYNRMCLEEDISTDTIEDFTIGPDASLVENVDMMMTHGATIIKDILTQNTTAALREYIVETNHKTLPDDQFYVHAWENRWSLKMGLTDHWSIPEALEEIGKHPILMPIVEKILGPHAAMMEVTSITSGYGAEAQHWHSDTATDGSALIYGRTYLPSYTLFIPLQKTTNAIGATSICPGTHMCAGVDENDCTDADITVEVDAGSAMFMNQNAWHHGGAHVDPDGMERVMFVVSFMIPQKKGDHRTLPFGLTYSTRWDQFGHTVDDLLTVKEHPWHVWTSLGFFRGAKQKYWGWSWMMLNLMQDASGGIEQAGFDNYREIFYDNLVKVEPVLPLYYIISLLLYLNFVPRKTSPGGQSRKRFFLFHIIIALSAVIGMFVFCKTDWAQEISSGKRFHTPNFKQLPEESGDEYENTVVHPHTSYILATDRLSFYYLYEGSKFIDYHPGNAAFREVIETKSIIYRNLPVEFKKEFITDIFTQMIEERRIFLKQNEYGDWELMDMKEMFDMTREALLSERDVMTPYIAEQIKSITSRAKYDYGYAISERFVPGQMNDLKGKIYDEGEEMKPKTHNMIYQKLWWTPKVKGHHMRKYKTPGMYPLFYERKTKNGRLAAVLSGTNEEMESAAEDEEEEEEMPDDIEYTNHDENWRDLLTKINTIDIEHKRYLLVRDKVEHQRREEEAELRSLHESRFNATVLAMQHFEERILETKDAGLLEEATALHHEHKKYMGEWESEQERNSRENLESRLLHQEKCAEHSVTMKQTVDRVNDFVSTLV